MTECMTGQLLSGSVTTFFLHQQVLYWMFTIHAALFSISSLFVCLYILPFLLLLSHANYCFKFYVTHSFVLIEHMHLHPHIIIIHT